MTPSRRAPQPPPGQVSEPVSWRKLVGGMAGLLNSCKVNENRGLPEATAKYWRPPGLRVIGLISIPRETETMTFGLRAVVRRARFRYAGPSAL